MKQVEKMITPVQYELAAEAVGTILPKENPTEAVGSDWVGGTVNGTEIRGINYMSLHKFNHVCRCPCSLSCSQSRSRQLFARHKRLSPFFKKEKRKLEIIVQRQLRFLVKILELPRKYFSFQNLSQFVAVVNGFLMANNEVYYTN